VCLLMFENHSFLSLFKIYFDLKWNTEKSQIVSDERSASSLQEPFKNHILLKYARNGFKKTGDYTNSAPLKC